MEQRLAGLEQDPYVLEMCEWYIILEMVTLT